MKASCRIRAQRTQSQDPSIPAFFCDTCVGGGVGGNKGAGRVAEAGLSSLQTRPAVSGTHFTPILPFILQRRLVRRRRGESLPHI
jgi:hypothetical protein